MVRMVFIKILKNTIQIKKRIVFGCMIPDIISNKNLNPTVTGLLIRGRKLNICLVFITQTYFSVPKTIRLNSTHCFVMKIPNERELQQFAFNHSSDIHFQDFRNLYKKSIAEQYSFWLLILLFYQIILYVLERIFWEKYKSYSWQLMIRLDMKNCNMILTEKLQKYQPCHLEKLISLSNR